MAGKQAKILTEAQGRSVVRYLTEETRYVKRNLVIFLLSYRAGLRAGEISRLTWEMVLDPEGDVQNHLEVRDSISKKGSGRIVPMHSELKNALVNLRESSKINWRPIDSPVVISMRKGSMSAHSLVLWFRLMYATLGLEGCSSHTGRRTLATRSARNLSKAGGSLKDLQSILGHKNVATTQLYVDVSSEAKKKLIEML
jgi:integrase